jgi:tetratricopeptide (TPR) repeat protein
VTAADVLERVHHAGRLAEGGRFAALAAYLDGLEDEVRTSPTLAFLRGLAYARLGRHAEGERWVAAALELALARGDRTVEVRARNALGAIAWEQGAIEAATRHFRHALAEAERPGPRHRGALLGEPGDHRQPAGDASGRWAPTRWPWRRFNGRASPGAWWSRTTIWASPIGTRAISIGRATWPIAPWKAPRA